MKGLTLIEYEFLTLLNKYNDSCDNIQATIEQEFMVNIFYKRGLVTFIDCPKDPNNKSHAFVTSDGKLLLKLLKCLDLVFI